MPGEGSEPREDGLLALLAACDFPAFNSRCSLKTNGFGAARTYFSVVSLVFDS